MKSQLCFGESGADLSSIPDISIRVIRSNEPGEFVAVARMGLVKVGECFEHGKDDANATARAMGREFEAKGHTVKLFLK